MQHAHVHTQKQKTQASKQASAPPALNDDDDGAHKCKSCAAHLQSQPDIRTLVFFALEAPPPPSLTTLDRLRARQPSLIITLAHTNTRFWLARRR